MRTTLAIDDDVLTAAKGIAQAQGKTIGAVISELARRGLAPRPQYRRRGGLPVFFVSENAPPITGEMVKEAAEDD